MKAVYVQDDCAIDYTPGADVAAGDVVVQGDLIGVAKRAIPANTLGSLTTEGIFAFPKATGGGTAITAGTKVYWDPVASQATATAGALKYLGKTTKDAADADATVRVRLQQ
jgi:predicted RecA/RadA family phage recombinase